MNPLYVAVKHTELSLIISAWPRPGWMVVYGLFIALNYTRTILNTSQVAAVCKTFACFRQLTFFS